VGNKSVCWRYVDKQHWQQRVRVSKHLLIRQIAICSTPHRPPMRRTVMCKDEAGEMLGKSCSLIARMVIGVSQVFTPSQSLPCHLQGRAATKSTVSSHCHHCDRHTPEVIKNLGRRLLPFTSAKGAEIGARRSNSRRPRSHLRTLLQRFTLTRSVPNSHIAQFHDSNLLPQLSCRPPNFQYQFA
jgi:hypothetical protein